MVDVIITLAILIWSIVCLLFIVTGMKKRLHKKNAALLGILAILWVIHSFIQTETFWSAWSIFMALFLALCAIFIFAIAREIGKFQKEMDEEVRKAKEEANEMVENLK